jgi:hypothetical protein
MAHKGICFAWITGALLVACGGESTGGERFDPNDTAGTAPPVKPAVGAAGATDHSMDARAAEPSSMATPSPASQGCADWLVDDFDGGAQTEMRWGHWDDPETDGVAVSELLPEPTAAGATKALHVALDFAEPTSVDVTTHAHWAPPNEYAALKFRAKVGSASASELLVAITDDAAGKYWEDSQTRPAWNTMSLSLTQDWQAFTLPVNAIVQDDAIWSSPAAVIYHFVLPNVSGVDVWLDDVSLVCKDK